MNNGGFIFSSSKPRPLRLQHVTWCAVVLVLLLVAWQLPQTCTPRAGSSIHARLIERSATTDAAGAQPPDTPGATNTSAPPCTASNSSSSSSDGLATAPPPSRAPSEWNNHIIFEAKQGRLEPCPSSSSSSSSDGWLPGTWTHPQSLPAGASGFMLPLTTRVQQLIWQHQHPADCSTAKFLLYQDPGLDKLDHGIGSVLHIQTMAFMMALNSGRVLVTLPGAYLAADPYCSPTNRSTLDSCYFMPLTHCNVTQEQAQGAWKFAQAPKEQQDAFLSLDGAAASAGASGSEAQPQFATLEGYVLFFHKLARTAPRRFHELLKGTDIPQRTWHYWWRAQALAYIMRPNERTQQQLAVRQRDMLRGLPLSPGCVSVYIRHGDKGREAHLFPDAQYEEALQRLRAIDPALTRQVFLSTEDPASVVYFTNASRNWGTSYVDMPRKPDPTKANVHYMREFGFANSMLDGLLNLHLAMTCDGFVSGFSSNWARMINELRSTVRCKADAIYMDVSNARPSDFYERRR